MAQTLYTRRELRKRFLGLRNERPKAEPGRALVLLGEDAPIVLYPGQTISPGESVWGKHDTIYEVDITQKNLSFRTSAPAKGGVWEFTVTFSGSYQVSDPLEVINQGIQDPVPMLQLVIKDIISQVTQQFDIEDGESARMAVRKKLEEGLGKKAPFKLGAIYIELEPDEEAKEFIKEQRRQARKATLIKGSKQVIEAQDSIDRLQRQMRREGEAEMVAHYEKMLDKGITTILAQQLAQNPENAPQITNFLLQLRQQDIQGKVEILQTMVEKDMIEDWQLKDLVDDVIQSTRAGALGATPSLPTSQSKGALPDQSHEKSSDAPPAEDTSKE